MKLAADGRVVKPDGKKGRETDSVIGRQENRITKIGLRKK